MSTRNGNRLFAIAVLALASGIGTAVFSLVHAVLLRPLPFRDAGSIQVVWKANPRTRVPFIELAYPELEDLQRNVKAFTSVAVMPTTLYGYGKVLQTANADPVQLESAPVSQLFLSTLGVAPALGRDFNASDEHVGAAPVVLLSDRVWRQNFHADPAIVGRQIRLSGTGHTVIGVMKPDFDFPAGASLWIPLGVSPLREMRGATYLQAIARTAPGATDAQVNTQVSGLFDRLAREYPQFYSAGQQPVITDLPGYLTGSARPQLLIALAASLLLLATGCITASNLFVSQTLRRSREIATRVALGATRLDIAKQFLREGLTAATVAGAGGLLLAFLLIRVLVFLAPPDIPGIALAALNLPVALFALALTLLTAVACSAAPALIAAGMTRANRPAERLQGAFTFAQTSITVVLLTVSLLTVISVRALLNAHTGFTRRDTVTLNLPLKGIDAKARTRLYARLLERLRESPGVTNAGAVLLRPLEGTIGWDMHYQPEYQVSVQSGDLPVSEFEVVTPGYFDAVGAPLLEGRNFSPHDTADSEHTMIVSRSIAQRFRRAGLNPIGARIRFGRAATDEWFKIVGVVADSRYRSVSATGDGIYLNYLQTGIPVNYIAVTGNASRADLIQLVRGEVAKLDPSQAIANVATVGQLIDANTARARFNMALLFTFGAGALLLAGAGIFSVVAETVSVRRKEIAIRVALGAQRGRLITRLIRSPLRCVLAGEAVGCVAAIAAAKSIAQMLYSVNPADPLILGFVAGFLLSVAFIATAVPAWIAAGLEPYPVLKSA